MHGKKMMAMAMIGRWVLCCMYSLCWLLVLFLNNSCESFRNFYCFNLIFCARCWKLSEHSYTVYTNFQSNLHLIHRHVCQIYNTIQMVCVCANCNLDSKTAKIELKEKEKNNKKNLYRVRPRTAL